MNAAEFRLTQVRGWSEKEFQQQVVGLARALGWEVYHPYDSRRSARGYPDLTMVHPRHGVVFAELKTEKGSATADQRKWLAALEAAPGVHQMFLWRPRHWADRTIHETLSAGG